MSGRLFPYTRRVELSKLVVFRLTEDEYQRLKGMAFHYAVGMSTLLRRLIDERHAREQARAA